MKVSSARLPSPKTMVGSPSQILAQFPKQQSPKQLQQSSPSAGSSVAQIQTTSSSPGAKPTIQIKQESGKDAFPFFPPIILLYHILTRSYCIIFLNVGVKIITQQVQPSKILPKPSSVALSSSSSSPIMVVSSNGTIMTTKLVTQPTGGHLIWFVELLVS